VADRQTRVLGGNLTRTQSFELAPGILQYVQSVLIEVDTTASPDTTPLLTVKTQDGVPVADKAQGRAMTGGATGRATWALRLDDEVEPGVTSVVSADPELWTFPTTGPAVSIGRFTIGAQITRDAAAPALNVATGALVVTTTSVKHNIVDYQHGVTANVAATPSRLTIVSAGLYLIETVSGWANFGAADFGMCVGPELGVSGLVNPGTVSRRVLGQVLVHQAVNVQRCNAGQIITHAVGQNSGAPIAMGSGTLSAYRLGPLP
jgi:hypothetical protein